MPVDLSAIPQRRTVRLKPPSKVVWSISFAIWMMVWGLFTLWLWPPQVSTHSWRFWMILCGLPSILFGMAYAIPWIVYQVERNSVASHNIAREYVLQSTIRYEQQPLHILAYAYQTALGVTSIADKIVAGRKLLSVRANEGGHGESVRCTRLPVASKIDEAGASEQSNTPSLNKRYTAAVDGLLVSVASVGSCIPRGVSLSLVVCVPDDVEVLALAQFAEKRAGQLGILISDVQTQPHKGSAMMLDAWLDESPNRNLDHCALVIAAQLYDTPPQNGAEIAVALLIGGPKPSISGDILPIAHLHRPVAGPGEAVAQTLQTAVGWADVAVGQFERVWLSGLDHEIRPLLEGVPGASLIGGSKDSAMSVADVDIALGHGGVAAPWLAIVLGAERLVETGCAQIWVTGTIGETQIGAIA